jgi:hypothetical protein
MDFTKKDADKLYPLFPRLYSTGSGKKSQPLLLDFDSARAVAWAFGTIYDEANNSYESGNKAVRATLKQLAKELKLKLPKAPDIIEVELKETLDSLNNYDPYKFRKLLSGLSSEIGTTR